jgi:hypothetical protein
LLEDVSCFVVWGFNILNEMCHRLNGIFFIFSNAFLTVLFLKAAQMSTADITVETGTVGRTVCQSVSTYDNLVRIERAWEI